jgi:hypothetical protein
MFPFGPYFSFDFKNQGKKSTKKESLVLLEMTVHRVGRKQKTNGKPGRNPR